VAVLSTPRRAAVIATAAAVVAALTLMGLPPGAAAPPSPVAPTSPEPAGPSERERKGNLDTRATSVQSPSGKQLRRRAADQQRLVRRVGGQSIVSIDPLTGTPRNVARLDGYLTKASTAPAQRIALRYVRQNASVLGLSREDLSTLRLRRDYVDVSGTHHLSWVQVIDGIEVFSNGLKAHVTKAGRLLAIQGAPVSGVSGTRLSRDPEVSAAEARAKAAKDVGGKPAEAKAERRRDGALTRWSNNDVASLVWFMTPRGLRLGWSTLVAAGNTLDYQHVIDAANGRVLYRRDLVAGDKGDALVFPNYPGAPVGGEQTVVNLIDRGWLSARARTLSGRYAVAWADVLSDNFPTTGETVTVPGDAGRPPEFRLQPFNQALSVCSASFICTWDPDEPFSWEVNQSADITQGFYYISIFHDYLARSPIGFTPDAGNFEAADGDPVTLNGLDGAAGDGSGLPDASHVNNASMATPPDGFPPRMEMYLFHQPGATAAQDPLLPASSSFDPSVLTHEYVHGLSNRLVVDAQGNSTLNGLQAGAMGEAWSDYYAMDYLVARGLQPETGADGDVELGHYLGVGRGDLFRSMPIDCSVGSPANVCVQPSPPNTPGTPGGYTYADIAAALGIPEVHGTGEIWGQTLWDLRKRFGRRITNSLVTRAMELSPADPSFLDMRNSILQADLAVYGGRLRAAIWEVFAERGMGFFAGTLDAADVRPAEDFSVPPPPGTPTFTLRGQVTNRLTGAPVPNAVVAIGGLDSGFPGSYVAATNAEGRYAIARVYPGTYPKVTMRAAGYERITRSVRVAEDSTTADFEPRFDWAATSAGGSIVDFNGPDFTPFGCGPGNLIDLSLADGWVSTTGDNEGTPTNTMIPKSAVIKLPAAVTVTGFAIDPSTTCGLGGSASTGNYRVEVSSDGTTWNTVQSGTFGVADRRLNDIPLGEPVANVQFVRVTLLSPQVPNFATNCPTGNFSGCTFTAMTELEVFGVR
jgi:extracellular elastinolytic metalloproteinase